MVDYTNVGDNNPDGVTMGKSATEKTSFHGVTPVVQAATIAAVATTGSTSGTPFGYTTTAQADAVIANLNAIRAALVDKGIIASA